MTTDRTWEEEKEIDWKSDEITGLAETVKSFYLTYFIGDFLGSSPLDPGRERKMKWKLDALYDLLHSEREKVVREIGEKVAKLPSRDDSGNHITVHLDDVLSTLEKMKGKDER